MNVCKKILVANLAVLSFQACDSFVPAHQKKFAHHPTTQQIKLGAHVVAPKEEDEFDQQQLTSSRSKIAAKAKPIALSFISLLSVFSNAKPSIASAPVTPIRQFKPQDQKKIALDKMNEERNKIQMQEQMEHQLKCEEIEQSDGKAAREAYEKEYENKKIVEAEQRVVKRKELLYGLLQQGICPYMDLEGERQVYQFDHGIDLATVPTTPQQKEFMNLRRNPKLVQRRSKERFIIKCIVDDLIAKGEDPLDFFQNNKDKTMEIYGMSDKKLDAIAGRYKAIVEGQKTLSGIIAEKPFDVAVAIGVAPSTTSKVEPSKAEKAAEKAAKKAEAAKLKAAKKAAEKEAKAAAKAAATKLKAEQKAAKLAAKAEAAKLKAQQKAEQQAVKSEQEETQDVEEIGSDEDPVADVDQENDLSPDEQEMALEEGTSSSVTKQPGGRSVPIVGLVGLTGGGLMFKKMKEQNLAAEEERQKQFRLIMGLDSDDEDDDDDNGVDDLVGDFIGSNSFVPPPAPKKTTPSSQPSISDSPKKRRKGLASVFAKKGSNRETDLNNLITPDASAPQLSILLAKLLSFGAPGRFPLVEKIPGGMPMESFDLEEAKKLLTEARTSESLSAEVSAEAFACVVNCMIIDIVDLASSSLGEEKKNKMTVDALNVVMDFMDHAASLFDSVADGVVITPVTYGGSLGKSKLEKMFTIYSSSMMTSLEGGVTQDRIDTLQQVFNISDKRAEGLIQKGMMKNLMEMMKNPEAMEGMEGMDGLSDMMAAMAGGEGGMPGFDPNGEISPEELKQSVAMMKELVDSGSVSKEELAIVKQQFSEMYGSDITELIKAADEGDADELGEDGKELLDLFKTILKED